MTWTNKLYYGDCFTVMQEMNLGSVDLIYLDPPFKSNQDYNAIYEDETGRPLPDQIEAFSDTWTLNAETERAIRHMPVLMREAGVTDEIAEFWRLWDECAPQYQRATLGLPLLHGSATLTYEGHPEAHRLDLPSLRPNGLTLCQGDDGCYFRARELSQ